MKTPKCFNGFWVWFAIVLVLLIIILLCDLALICNWETNKCNGYPPIYSSVVIAITFLAALLLLSRFVNWKMLIIISILVLIGVINTTLICSWPNYSNCDYPPKMVSAQACLTIVLILVLVYGAYYIYDRNKQEGSEKITMTTIREYFTGGTVTQTTITVEKNVLNVNDVIKEAGSPLSDLTERGKIIQKTVITEQTETSTRAPLSRLSDLSNRTRGPRSLEELTPINTLSSEPEIALEVQEF